MKNWFLISLLLFVAFPAMAEAELSSTEQRYSDLFIRQEMVHKTYKETSLALTDINQRDSVLHWYRLLFKDRRALIAYRRASGALSRHILGKDFRDLAIYFAATGQGGKAQKVVGFYYLSVMTLLDNFAHDGQAKIWAEKSGFRWARKLDNSDWISSLSTIEHLSLIHI